ncbi:MAG: helix-turn-helix domain-containing protein [Burkholderiaceae bacterium]|nr:helix-turn-helix domain-containing protein [Burkholderiaceae bacterium]
MDNEVKALTIPEICRRNKQGRTTIYAEIKSGRLKSYKLGRSRRIRPEDEAALQLSYVEQAKGTSQ